MTLIMNLTFKTRVVNPPFELLKILSFKFARSAQNLYKRFEKFPYLSSGMRHQLPEKAWKNQDLNVSQRY